MSRCAVYVPKRSYGQPGPCASRRGVLRIEVSGTSFLACAAHRNVIQGGRIPAIVRGRR